MRIPPQSFNKLKIELEIPFLQHQSPNSQNASKIFGYQHTMLYIINTFQSIQCKLLNILFKFKVVNEMTSQHDNFNTLLYVLRWKMSSNNSIRYKQIYLNLLFFEITSSTCEKLNLIILIVCTQHIWSSL